jgi:restriction endonuclease S subunit
MAFVPKEALATLPVDLPPSDVQHSIVALDALLRRERRLTDELLEQRARLVQTLTKRAAAGKER